MMGFVRSMKLNSRVVEELLTFFWQRKLQNGLMIAYDPGGAEASSALRRASLQDVAGTVLDLHGIELGASLGQPAISEGAAVGR